MAAVRSWIMKTRGQLLVLAGVSVAMVLLPGCQRKVEPGAELEKAAQLFDARLPDSGASPAAAGAPAAAREMKSAVAAYQNGNLSEAVVRLQTLRAAPVLNPSQRIALNEAMGTVMTDIYARAAKGDAQAQQAVRRYE